MFHQTFTSIEEHVGGEEKARGGGERNVIVNVCLRFGSVLGAFWALQGSVNDALFLGNIMVAVLGPNRLNIQSKLHSKTKDEQVWKHMPNRSSKLSRNLCQN